MKTWIESTLRKDGAAVVVGVDEAGRGAVAGPLCAAAVAYRVDSLFERVGDELLAIQDSKRLTLNRRNELFRVILKHALAVRVVAISNRFIDERGIQPANELALRLAGDSVVRLASLRVGEHAPVRVFVDHFRIPGTSWIGITYGDSLSVAIASASIVAKVVRDELMAHLGEIYPSYGFEQHKGYGTKDHQQSLEEHGVTCVHRRQFCASLLQPRLW
jgi:ribonuclease HII